MMKRITKIGRIAMALGAMVFLNGCYSPSVDSPQSAVAYIYKNAGVRKTIRFTAETPATAELQAWVKFNNGTWYRRVALPARSGRLYLHPSYHEQKYQLV